MLNTPVLKTGILVRVSQVRILTHPPLLDITNKQLEEYRKTHFVCEICGKPEKISHNGKNVSQLCCDHNHKTSKFRGLLCCDCNRKLGWFENLEEEILNYLHKKN